MPQSVTLISRQTFVVNPRCYMRAVVCFLACETRGQSSKARITKAPKGVAVTVTSDKRHLACQKTLLKTRNIVGTSWWARRGSRSLVHALGHLAFAKWCEACVKRKAFEKAHYPTITASEVGYILVATVTRSHKSNSGVAKSTSSKGKFARCWPRWDVVPDESGKRRGCEITPEDGVG